VDNSRRISFEAPRSHIPCMTLHCRVIQEKLPKIRFVFSWTSKELGAFCVKFCVFAVRVVKKTRNGSFGKSNGVNLIKLIIYRCSMFS
jgi:hypothetical protein